MYFQNFGINNIWIDDIKSQHTLLWLNEISVHDIDLEKFPIRALNTSQQIGINHMYKNCTESRWNDVLVIFDGLFTKHGYGEDLTQ